jgi:hypothetical protein
LRGVARNDGLDKTATREIFAAVFLFAYCLFKNKLYTLQREICPKFIINMGQK